MDSPYRRLCRPLLLLILLFNFGCGNSALEFVHPGPEPNEPEPVTQAALHGRVFVGAPVPNVEIEVLSLDGDPLYTTTADDVGTFSIFGLEAPEDFLVRASLGPETELTTYVQGYSGEAHYVVLNARTSLVSAYLQANPGATQAEANSKVASFLEVPDDYDLQYTEDEGVGEPFSHLVFFGRAAQHGGWVAFRDLIASELDGTPENPSLLGQPYRLTRETADLPLSGLHPTLVSALQSFRNSRSTELSLVSRQARPSPDLMERLINGPAAAALDPNALVASETLNFLIVDTLLEKAVDGAADAVIGHIADALGLNYGEAGQLEEIQAELLQVLGYLTDIISLIDAEIIASAAQSITDDISEIDTLNHQLGIQDLGAILANPETPYTPTDDISDIISSVVTFDVLTALDSIQKAMLGTGNVTNIISKTRDVYLAEQLGLQAGGTWGNFPLRTDSLVNSTLNTYNYYGGYQEMGINILAEASHAGTNNPSNKMTTALKDAIEAANSLKQQRHQLPMTALGNSVIVDLQAGLMWYYQVQSEKSFSDAKSVADSFTLTTKGITYTDWRIPTAAEARTLQDRGRFVATGLRDSTIAHDGSDSSYGNHGYSTQGLPSLGFSGVNKLNSNGDILRADYSYANGAYHLEGTGRLDPNYESRLNHENTFAESSTSHRPFLMVRSIGTPLNPIAGTLAADSAPIPFTTTDPSSREIALLGRVTGLSGVGGVMLDQLGAQITFTLNVGGTYSMGTDSEASRTIPSHSFSTTVATYDGTIGSNATPNEYNDHVWYTGSDPNLVTVTHTGKMFWHVDDNSVRSIQVTAHAQSLDGNVYTGNGNVSENPPVRTLRAVQLFPRNRQYDLITQTTTTEQYHLLAYYSDQTVRDVSSEATWTVVDDATGQPTAGASFSNQQDGLLIVDNTAPQLIRITASIGSGDFESDTTRAQILLNN